MPTWESFAGDSYETVAVPYYRSIREEREARRKLNPHTHEWMLTSTLTGENTRYCTSCGEAQEQMDVSDPNAWKIIKKGVYMEGPASGVGKYSAGGRIPASSIDSVYIDPTPGHVEYIGDHLGFADYHPKTQEIELNDGTIVSRETVLRANPGMSSTDLERLLRSEARRVAIGSSSSGAATRLAELTKMMDSLGVSMSQYGNTVSGNRPKLLSPDDALQLIIEVIRHSDDPFVTGGEWMTKFTNAVTEVIRESEAENDPE